MFESNISIGKFKGEVARTYDAESICVRRIQVNQEYCAPNSGELN